MSSFQCEKCRVDIIDSKNGYVTECLHYPITDRKKACPVCGCQIFDPFGMGMLVHDVVACIEANNIPNTK